MLSEQQIRDRLKKIKKHRVYTPMKYFKGLKYLKEVDHRYKRIVAGTKNKNNFSAFKTDKGKKTRPSSYTSRFYMKYPGAKSLAQKSKATGVPLGIIREVYNKGLAAWRTGHRPGATGQQWGYARVHSFLLCGKTARTADKYLANRVKFLCKQR